MGCGGSSLQSKETFYQALRDNKYKKIAVVTGNHVSAKSGVPDIFLLRSEEQSKKERSLNLDDMFSIVLEPKTYDNPPHYEKDHLPFYNMYRQLIKTEYQPNGVHKLLALFHTKDILLMHSTNTLDGLGVKAGVPERLTYEIEGNYRQAVCTKCRNKTNIARFNEVVLASDNAVICEVGQCGGKLKPDIFFDSDHLDKKFNFLFFLLGSCDLFLVIGSDLQEHSLKHLVKSRGASIPLVIINPSEPSVKADLLLRGDPDIICNEIVNILSSK